MSFTVSWRPSPNHDERRAAVRFLMLHYTGMERASEALDWLCNPESRVSAHWFIDTDGTVTQMVAESRRAWHAGRGMFRGVTDMNSASVGIELHNPGHEWGYRPFPRRQMEACLWLVGEIVARHRIDRADVIGHSDFAPTRKDDPGERFDWGLLAAHGLALARPARLLPDPGWEDAAFLAALARFGYDVADPQAAVRAFQRRFRQARVDGAVDGETRAILATLLRDEAARQASGNLPEPPGSP
ncbi:MAG: N-acetylmuramoyl-L-alanine amidase [Sphingomonadaceae bacterium]